MRAGENGTCRSTAQGVPRGSLRGELHKVGQLVNLAANAGEYLVEKPAGRVVNQRIVSRSALATARDDARPVQDAKMARDVLRRARHVVGKLLNRCLMLLEQSKKLDTGRICEKRKATRNQLHQRA